MYSIVENVLKTSDYDLAVMLKKIDRLWLEGKLTDEECAELKEKARGSAKAENSVVVLEKLKDLDARLSKLENDNNNNSNPEEETTEEYPEYIEGKWYYTGDKVSFEGVDYVCTAPEGTVCVWSPKDYPTYWDEV